MLPESVNTAGIVIIYVQMEAVQSSSKGYSSLGEICEPQLANFIPTVGISVFIVYRTV